MVDDAVRRPDWDALYETALGQAGHFTLKQARGCGFSSQLLQKHLAAGRVVRIRRGVYRLVHFPREEHEELVAIWLWSEQVGVFSHETSLVLHGLSDALPARVHLTLPTSWRSRRLRVPEDVVLHFADLDAHDRAWFGPIPLTSVQRMLDECMSGQVRATWVEQAIEQARLRGLLLNGEARSFRRRLRNAQRAD